MADVSLELLAVLIQRGLDGQAALRREVADVRTVCLQVVEHSRRLERRMEEMRDDLELIVKSELMGRLAMFEAKVEAMIENQRAPSGM